MGINAVYNIINKIVDNNINILYQPSYTLFDYSIQHTPYNIHANTNQYYGYYDLAMINDWQHHATNRLSFLSQHQIMDLLFFHHPCPKNFKKEDKAIFDKSTQSTYKIFLSQLIYDSWNLSGDRSFHIDYGVLDSLILDNTENHKTNSVLFCNLDNRSEYNGLFRSLSNYCQNMEMVTLINGYDDVIQKMRHSNIVIDLHHGIHTLYAIMCGAKVITNQTIDPKLLSPIYVSNVNQILNIVNSCNVNHDRNLIEKDQQYIISVYNMNNFTTKLGHIINKMKVEPFVL